MLSRAVVLRYLRRGYAWLMINSVDAEPLRSVESKNKNYSKKLYSLLFDCELDIMKLFTIE